MRASAKNIERTVMQPLLFGCITGIVCGAVLALFLVCSKVVFHFVFGLYEDCDGPLVAVCIAILALLCCFLTAALQTVCPTAKGSGIPLAEGSARGMLRVRWLSNAAALIVGSLLSFMSGMPLGSEGPSVGIGGLIGEGVGKTAKKPMEFRRYLITGGASAGLAIAFNAPLAGVCFAFEETHRRFSPYIITSAAAAVVTGLLTSQSLFLAFGQIPYLASLGVAAGAHPLAFLHQAPLDSASALFAVGAAALCCGIICGLLGALFNRLIYALAPIFGKIKYAPLRLLPAFALAAACGLCLYYCAGSGEAAFEALGMSSAVWLLMTVLVLRLLTTATASASGATGGLFLPMIAIGGIAGLLLAKACTAIGIAEQYAPNIVMLCICAFFTGSVQAPISAVVLSVELTASFANLLPCIIAAMTALVIADLVRTEPLYERMLENLNEHAPLSSSARTLSVTGSVPESSPIAYKRIRNIMWPYNSLVTELDRGGAQLVPDGETKLIPGDIITVRAENVTPEWFYSQIREYIDADVGAACPDTDFDKSNIILTARNTSDK